MKISRPIFFRGATAWEWQIGMTYGRIIHLSGKPWPWWAPWRRFSIHKQQPEA